MKKQTIKELKKHINYARDGHNFAEKSYRITQLYIYLMYVYDEVKNSPILLKMVNQKAHVFLHEPEASNLCVQTMQLWLDKYSNEEELTLDSNPYFRAILKRKQQTLYPTWVLPVLNKNDITTLQADFLFELERAA